MTDRKAINELKRRQKAIGLAISALKEREKRSNDWISVKDRLPEPFVSVLTHMPEERPLPTVHEGYISRDGIWTAGMFRREPGEVTQWMPMPEPPKEDSRD